jgi:p70 ribosomal S6 kinase
MHPLVGNGDREPMDAIDQLTATVQGISIADLHLAAEDFKDFKQSAESLDDDEQKESSIPKNQLECDQTSSKTNDSQQQKNLSAVNENQSASKRYVSTKDFELLKVIGMGAFGKVLQVRNKYSGQVLAMKVISKRLLQRKTGYVENIRAERDILTRVRHPFVVSMHCSFQTSEKLFIIMDFLAGGELFLRLGREGIFLEKTAAFYLAEIILALDHLHTHGILHRDLKPENILLGSDGHVCLTDFGLAKDFSGQGGFNDTEDDARALTVCGTQEYMAPEMIARKGYGRAADYWSLGCIAYEMLKGLPPFQSKLGAKDLFRKIMTERVKMPEGSSAPACKLLKGLLNRNAQARWGVARSTMFEIGNVAGLKGAEFFAGIDWEKLALKAFDPPDVFSVSDDVDTQYFHDEFTKMTLPRSVVIMSTDAYRPKQINSENFKGFSFIQDDFYLPDRDDEEMKSYYNSVEGDGESVSECASSKCLDFPVEEKKRPPRKRKKKNQLANALSPLSTPATSAFPTPGTSNANSPVLWDDTAPIATLATPEVKSLHVGSVCSSEKKSPFKAEPVFIDHTIIVQKPIALTSTSELKSLILPNSVSGLSAATSATYKPALTEQAHAKSRSQIQANQGSLQVRSKHQPQLIQQGLPITAGWGKVSKPVQSHHTPLPPPLETSVSRDSPVSDWRQHTMTPRISPHKSHANPGYGKQVRQLDVNQSEPIWPSLANDPPLPSKKATSAAVPIVKLQGAWAARK